VHLFLDFSNSSLKDVPDPYYGQGRGFEIVLNMVEDASQGLLQHISNNITPEA
jgi:protein-tyrosine phosphatase